MAPFPSFKDVINDGLKSIDKAVDDVNREVNGGPNLDCMLAGRLSGPTFKEMMDFDKDCNTFIESLGIEAGWIWWPLVIIFVFLPISAWLWRCACGGYKPGRRL